MNWKNVTNSRVVHLVLALLPAFGIALTAAWVLARRAGCDSLDCVSAMWSQSYAGPLPLLCLAQVLYSLLQGVQWSLYRAYVPQKNTFLPSLCVVVPAYNEDTMIEVSVRSVLDSNYPADLLEVIVVDDGSSDNTYSCICALQRHYPGRIEVIRFAKNQGKRAALAAGIRAAQGSLIVTLDSDSIIQPDSLRALIAPLQQATSVGIVAGRVEVLNASEILGRMLQVQYALAFDFTRACQSSYQTVACCPGALSAFRRECVVPYLDAWLNQRFLGRAVRHGEDHALTNIVLKQGYSSVYQCDAVVHTVAPTHYGQLTRMLTRWDRSFIVEGLASMAFLFTRCYRPQRLLAILNLLVGQAQQILRPAGLISLAYAAYHEPGMLPTYVLGIVFAATFSSMYYLHTKWNVSFVYGVLYAVFSLLYLQWTFIWALLTVRDERWGTR